MARVLLYHALRVVEAAMIGLIRERGDIPFPAADDPYSYKTSEGVIVI